jgi:hypothetical protein
LVIAAETNPAAAEVALKTEDLGDVEGESDIPRRRLSVLKSALKALFFNPQGKQETNTK